MEGFLSMFWEDQIKIFLEDEQKLAELFEKNKAFESLRHVEDHILQHNLALGHITGYVKFEEVDELDMNQQQTEDEEYLYQYMKRNNELSSEIAKLQKSLRKLKEDWIQELKDLDYE